MLSDQDLRNIIDKLAQFVARNGPEFEKMTKNKQKNNPKFSFLYGGEYFNYYQYKVTTEQASKHNRVWTEELEWAQCRAFAACYNRLKWILLFIVLKQSAGGQAAAPAGAFMAQNRQYVLPQQGSATAAQIGLAASMSAAPALQQWLAANAAPPAPAAPAPPAPRTDRDSLAAQVNILKEQITQSENNLNAQHKVS